MSKRKSKRSMSSLRGRVFCVAQQLRQSLYTWGSSADIRLKDGILLDEYITKLYGGSVKRDVRIDSPNGNRSLYHRCVDKHIKYL